MGLQFFTEVKNAPLLKKHAKSSYFFKKEDFFSLRMGPAQDTSLPLAEFPAA
jgi:hypothetical protein